MNDTDLELLLARSLEPDPTDRLRADRVVDSVLEETWGSRTVAARRSRPHRGQRRWLPATAVAGSLVVASLTWLAASTRTASDPTPSVPTENLTVTCTERGTQLDRAKVAAQRDGVHVHVVNTMPFRVSLAYRADGGETSYLGPYPGSSEHVLVVPPGPVEFACSLDATLTRRSAPAHVTVTDPGGFYRGTFTPDACPQRLHPGVSAGKFGPWGYAANGPTPREALRRLIAGLEAGEAGPASLPPAERDVVAGEYGYLDQERQMWLIRANGYPEVWASVQRRDRRDDEYVAFAEVRCRPPLDPSRPT